MASSDGSSGLPGGDQGQVPDAGRVTQLLQDAGHDVTVTGVDASPVGTGQMGASFRLHLTYDGDPGPLPPTLVAKVAAGPPEKRAVAAGSYRTEVAFYRTVAPTVAVRTPQCWASWMNDDGTDFVLLLEDLAPRRQGDQIAGCTPAEAVAAAVNLAGLHGPRWGDPTLAADGGLNVVDEEQADLLGAVMAPMTDRFVQRFADRLDAGDRRVLEAVPAVTGAWIVGRSQRSAPVHGDYRLDNLLFHPDGRDVAAVDWQTVSLGLPARDLAFLCATGLDADLRRASEEEIVAAYHEALVGHGVTDHPLAECLDDYGYAMLQAPLIIVLGWSVAEPTARGDEMFLAMTERSCAAIRHHDTLDRV